MALTPLAVSTTVNDMEAQIRSRTGTISPQASELLSTQIADIIHNALVLVRHLLGKLIDGFYSTSITVTESNGLIDISTYNIANINRMTLNDSTHKLIPFVTEQTFYGLQTQYGATKLAHAVFATVSNINEKLQIKVFRGSAKQTPGTLTLSFPRSPQRAVGNEKLDIPEAYIPIVEDIATLTVQRRFTPERVDPALENRTTAFIQSHLAQLGLEISPKKGSN